MSHGPTPLRDRPPGAPPADPFATPKINEDLLKILRDLGPDFAKSLGIGTYDAPGSAPPGTTGWPRLAAPLVNLDALVAQLEDVQAELNIARGKTAGESIEIVRDRRERQNEDALKKLKEIEGKVLEALAKQNENKIAGWFQAVFGLIGAAFSAVAAFAATGLSFGVAAPAAVAACFAVGMAIMNIIDMSVKEAGIKVTGADGKTEALEISLGAMVKAIVNYSVEKGHQSFASEEDKQNYIAAMTIFANVFVVAVMLALTGPSMVHAFKSVKDAVKEGVEEVMDNLKEAGSKLEVMANTGVVISDLGESAATITQGDISLDTAEIQRDSEKARADNQRLRDLMELSTQILNRFGEALRDAALDLNASWSDISNMLASLSETNLKVFRQMS